MGLLAPPAPHLRVALNVREELGQDVHHELVLGGNPLMDAPIDVIERGLRRVELALARLWFFALGFLTPPAIKRILGLLSKPLLVDGAHYHMPRATAITITRIMAIGLSVWVASAA